MVKIISVPLTQTIKSLSAPVGKKTVGRYSKSREKRDFWMLTSCQQQVVFQEQIDLAFFFFPSRFSVKSFVLLSACCSSLCNRLLLCERYYLYFTLCLDSKDCFSQPALSAFAIVQLFFIPSVLISFGLSSSFSAESRSMHGLVVSLTRCLSGCLFKNWSLALCVQSGGKNNKAKEMDDGFFLLSRNFRV